LLRRALERVTGSGPVLVPEYRLRPSARWGWDGRPVLESVAAVLAAEVDGYEQAIADVCSLAEWAGGIPRRALDPTQLSWENDWWGGVDALVQCAALRRRDPALYVEVGSGYSTLFARRAITDFGLRTRIVSIDPQPRTAVAACCDEAVRRPFQDAGPEVFARLGAGDVVLFDGSHVALMNGDATVFFLEVLPRLPAGVLVGIDDVFLPWDYPPTWHGRLYGEQYLLAALLIGGSRRARVRFPGWWLMECSPLADRFAPVWPAVQNGPVRRATSFWFEVEDAPRNG
jgi:hypothetical protein